jgi:diadenosine tetraphosphate (Ap4A) HIT family hydrolase
VSELSPVPTCVLCRGRHGDEELIRTEVWGDDLWRLTMSRVGEVAGFSYLEPRRHIGDIAALDGDEAASFGPTIARATSALKAATEVELVYVYVFGGGIPHLHVHLAPYVPGGPLNDQMVKGEVETRTLPSGASLIVSKDFPMRTREEHEDTIRRVRERMGR